MHIQLGCVNVQSIRNKTSSFVDNVDHVDLCVITETWLKEQDQVKVNEATPTGYLLNNTPRANRPGGGVALLYKTQFQLLKVETTDCKSCEITSWFLKYKNRLIRLVGFIEFLIQRNILCHVVYSIKNSVTF